MSDTTTGSVPRTFQVGDRVRYHGVDPLTVTPALEGKTGTITHDGPREATVRWDDGTASPTGVLYANLEHFAPQGTAAQRVVENLLARDNLDGILTPSRWIPAYRTALERAMPDVLDYFRRTGAPAGDDLIVGQYLCDRWGTIPDTGTFADFTRGQKEAIGRWWNENAERFRAWAENEAEASDSEVSDAEDAITVGTRLRITTDRPRGAVFYVGNTVEVVEVVPDGYHARLVGDSDTVEGTTWWLDREGTGWERLHAVDDVRTPRCDRCGITDEDSEDWCGECGCCAAHHGEGCRVGSFVPLAEGVTVAAGDKFRLHPEPHTHGGGGVFFGPTVTLVEATTDRGRGDHNVHVRALDGTPDNLTQHVGRGWLSPIVEPEPVVDEADALRERIADLERQVGQYQTDFETVGRMFGRAAVKEDLCGVYERTVERVNENLVIARLDADRPEPTTVTATRRRKMEVWVTEEGTLECDDHDPDTCSHDEDDFTWEDRGYTEHVVDAARENFDETHETDDFEVID